MEFHLTTDVAAGETGDDLVQNAAILQAEVEAALLAVCACPLSFAQETANFPPVAPPPSAPPPPPLPPSAPGGGGGGGSSRDTAKEIEIETIHYVGPGLGSIVAACILAMVVHYRRKELRYIRLNGSKMRLRLPDGCKFHTFLSHGAASTRATLHHAATPEPCAHNLPGARNPLSPNLPQGGRPGRRRRSSS